jgi:hypothetical protein
MAILWAMSLTATAHEFWMMPSTFVSSTDVPLDVNLYVGQFFEGELVPLSGEYVYSYWSYSIHGNENLTKRLPRTSYAGMPLSLAGAGSHVLAIDTYPNRVTLSADQFNYYLRDEGLDNIIAARSADGSSAAPSRERYRRHLKTLVSIGGKSDHTVFQRTGQRLEVLPLNNPMTRRAGDMVDFQLLFDNKPLNHVLVKAWHKQDGQTMVIRARANSDGIVQFTLPFSGTWMLSAVHMLAVKNDAAYDWDSFWGNLTFDRDAVDPQKYPAVPNPAP